MVATCYASTVNTIYTILWLCSLKNENTSAHSQSSRLQSVRIHTIADIKQHFLTQLKLIMNKICANNWGGTSLMYTICILHKQNVVRPKMKKSLVSETFGKRGFFQWAFFPLHTIRCWWGRWYNVHNLIQCMSVSFPCWSISMYARNPVNGEKHWTDYNSSYRTSILNYPLTQLSTHKQSMFTIGWHSNKWNLVITQFPWACTMYTVHFKSIYQFKYNWHHDTWTNCCLLWH